MAFKDSFNKVTKSISEGASNVVQKSNDLIEITKLNAEINNEEKKKEQIYLDIGKLVFENYLNNTPIDEKIKDKFEAILKHDEQIRNINKQILDVKKAKN